MISFTMLNVQLLRVKTTEGLLERLNELKAIRTKLDTEIDMADAFLHQRLQETIQKLEAQR